MRLDQLTFTRFIAAIFVVIYHYGQQVIPFNFTLLKPIIEKLNVSVSYFFVLSGFIMTYVYIPKIRHFSGSKFLRFRFARIYPLYILAMLLYVAICNHEVKWETLALNYLMLQAWFPEHVLAINYPGWSISAEVFFYLAFPLLIKMYRSLRLKKISIYLGIFTFSGIAVFFFLDKLVGGIGSSNFLVYAPIMHIFQFIVGNLCGILTLYLQKIYTPKNHDFIIFGLLILILVILYLDVPLPIYHGGLSLIFIPLLILSALNNGKITKIFSKKPFLFLGEISYGIYLLQVPIFILINKLNRFLNLDSFALFYFYLLLLILSAIMTYYLFETPFRNALRRKYKLIK